MDNHTPEVHKISYDDIRNKVGKKLDISYDDIRNKVGKELDIDLSTINNKLPPPLESTYINIWSDRRPKGEIFDGPEIKNNESYFICSWGFLSCIN